MAAKPAYEPLPSRPVPSDYGKPIPRIVNAAWMLLALREQARSIRAGSFQPWRPAELLERAANIIDLCCEPGSAQRKP